ncbi:DNase I-like protein, partial [Trametes versicolor FP-101664 SS1]|uniref:DNase I-like protein n=1 Tax=Trametes versicolor (strain FP-101664) TaxID=717944 RepID=UPI0004622EAC
MEVRYQPKCIVDRVGRDTPSYPSRWLARGGHLSTANNSNETNSTQHLERAQATDFSLGSARGAACSPAGCGTVDGGDENGGRPDGREDVTVNPRRMDSFVSTAEQGAENEQRRTNKKKPKSKARITVASLNMKGYGTEDRTNGSSKWLLINQLMRDRKLAVLAVQEAHLDSERLETLRRIFGRHLSIYMSADSENSTGARGVAIVINKRILKCEEPKLRDVVPGRALLIRIPWAEDRTLTLLNVYAPNDRTENGAFWDRLSAARLGRIDVLLGDFNVVEEGIDRIPVHTDPERATEPLRKLRDDLHLLDGWRDAYKQTKAFTFLQESTGSQSRIDRAYVRRAMLKDCDEWQITESGVPTDHCLVSFAVANHKAPFVGKGRWAMPAHLLEDNEMKKEMKSLGAALVADLERLRVRTDAANPQTVYEKFKTDLILAVRARAKAKVPKIQRQIDRLRLDLNKTLNDTNLGEGHASQSEANRTRNAAMLQARLAKLESKRFGWTRRDVAARHWAQSETISRYWTRAN